jgi:APA family basic amino acid/polyamine antiporter
MAQVSHDLPAPRSLSRSLNLPQALSLNIANMVGVGPFITIPLMLQEMRGPQVVVAWLVAGLLVLCDGLVWSELGAALPGSGGSYHFLKEIYGRLSPTWGRLIPFLFIWQFLISGTCEGASGYMGALKYLNYALPGLDQWLERWHVPGGPNTLAALLALCVTGLLCRHVRVLGQLSLLLCAGILGALLLVIVSGLPDLDPKLLRVPAGTFSSANASHFAHGLGAAMTIAIYDYFGYYNICYLGDEVRNPGRTIPRAVMGSVGVIGVLYLLMTVAIIGVIPWEEAAQSEAVAATVVARIFGPRVATAFAWLVVWTAIAGVFAMSLGYSRIPFAAARNGDFFKVFGTLHAGGFPVVSILCLGLLTAGCCYALRLEDVINASVAVRILIQFIGQIVGLHILRKTRPDVPLPFRMWLYPLPSLIAFAGWLFVLGTQDAFVLKVALGVTAAGVPAFFIWQSLTKPQAPSPTI